MKTILDNKKCRNDWHSRIYGKLFTDIEKRTYLELKTHFIVVFRHKCQGCFRKFFPYQLGLHHIISRDDGGKMDFDNMMLLCESCHNLAEESGEKTITGIKMYLRNYLPEISLPKPQKEKRKLLGAIKWQQWVYGGYKNLQIGDYFE